MSKKDERIVEMRFNNKEFERNAQQTLDTLDKLKKSSNFEEAGNGLEKITAAAKKVTLQPLENAVLAVEKRFSAMEIVAMTALVNITNSAVEAGKKLIKGLTVDNVIAGWEKLQKKTSAVGTMVSQGFNIDYVEQQMERLNFFTDETSYNFTDMADSISKFTASGKDLEESTTALIGIANWAANAGQNAQTASRAMYQLAQAAGRAMNKQDWLSVMNANMDTEEIRKQILETAAAMGTLQKKAEGVYSYTTGSKGNEVVFGVADFTEHLTKGAFATAEVMMEVYKKYGAAVSAIQDRVNDENYENIETASDALDEIKNYAKETGKTIDEAIVDLGYVAEDGSALFDELAYKSFRAGQEARSFADVIDSVKDAVSTSWMNLFQSIFGNYEEQVELWTGMANTLWDVFAGPINALAETFAAWKNFEIGGRSDLLDSLVQIGQALLNIIEVAKEAWHEIFPEKTAQKIAETVTSFKNISGTFLELTGDLEPFKTLLEGVFGVLDSILYVGRTITQGILTTIAGLLKIFGADIGSASESLGEFLLLIRDWIKSSQIVVNAVKLVVMVILYLGMALANVLHSFFSIEIVQDILSGLLTLIFTIGKALFEWGGRVVDVIVQFVDYIGMLRESGLSTIEIITNSVSYFFKNVLGTILDVGGVFSSLGNNVQMVFGGISDGATGVWAVLKSVGDGMWGFIKDIWNWISTNIGFAEIFSAAIFAAVAIIIAAVLKFMKTIRLFIEQVGGFLNSIKSVFTGFANVLNAFANRIKANAFKENAKAILIIAAAIAVLAAALIMIALTVPKDRLWETVLAIGALAGVIVGLAGLMTLFTVVANKFGGGGSLSFMAVLIGLAGSLYIFAQTVEKIIAILDTDTSIGKIVLILGVMAGIMAGLLVLIKIVTKNSEGNVLKGISMAALIVMFAYGIKKIVEAINNIDTSVGWDGMAKRIAVITTVILGLMGVMTVLGKAGPNVSKAAGSILKMSIGLALFTLVLKMIGSTEFGKELDNAEKYIAPIGQILIGAMALMFVAGKAGDNVSKAGSGIMKIAIGIGLLVGVLKLIDVIEFNDIQKAGNILAHLAIIIAALIAVSALAGKYSNRAGIMLLGAAGAILILTAAIVVLTKVDQTKIEAATATIKAILGMMALLIAASALAGKFHKSVIAITIAVAVVGAMFALFTLLDPEDAKKGIIATTAVIGEVCVLMLAASKLSKSEIKTKQLVLVLTMITFLSAIVYALSYIPDAEKAIIAAGAISIVMLTLSASLKLLNKVEIDESITKPIGIMLLAVLGLGAIMSLLSYWKFDENSITRATSIGILAVALGASMKLLNKVEIKSKLEKSIIKMAAIIGALGLVLSLLSLIPLSAGRLTETSSSLAIVMLSLGATMKLMNKVTIKDGVVQSIQSMIPIIFAVSLIIGLIAMIPGNFNVTIEAAASIGLVLLALGETMKLMHKVEVKDGTVDAIKKMIPIIAVVSTIIGLIAKLPGNTDSTIDAAASIGLVLVALAASIRIMKGLTINQNTLVILKKMIPIIAVVGGVIGLIAKLPGQVDSTIDAAASMGLVLIAMAASIKIMNDITIKSGVIKSLYEMLGIIGILGVVFSLLAKWNTGEFTSILATAASISIVLLAMAGSMNIMDGIKINDGIIKNMITMSIVVGILAVIMALIADVQATPAMIVLAGSISLILLSMAGAMAIIDGIKVDDNAVTTMLIMSAVVGVLAIIIGIIAGLNLDGPTLEIAASISVLLLAMGVAMRLLNGVVVDMGTAMTAVLTILAFVAGIALIAWALGALIGESEAFTQGIQIIVDLGKGLGEAIGGFIEGILNGFVSGLICPIAEEFARFFELIQDIPDSSFDHMWDMIGALAAIEGLKVLFGTGGALGVIKDAIYGELDLEGLGNTFKKLAEIFGDFAADMSGINEHDLNMGIDAAMAFTQTLNNLPRSGGIEQWWGGEISLKDIADGLKAYAPALVDYASLISGIDMTGMTNGVDASYWLYRTLINLQGFKEGFIPWLKGSVNLIDVAANLRAYAPALVAYANEVAKVDEGAMINGVNAAYRLYETINNLKAAYQPDFWDDFFGTDVLKNLSDKLPTLGSAIAGYGVKIREISEDDLSKMAQIPVILSGLANSITAMADMDPTVVARFATEIQNLGPITVSEFVSSLTSGSTNISIAQAVGAFIGKILECIKGYNKSFAEAGKAIPDSVVTGMSAKSSVIGDKIKTIMENALTIARSYLNDFKEVGAWIPLSVSSGMQSTRPTVPAQGNAMTSETEEQVRNDWDIHSESWDPWGEIGSWIPQSIANNIEKFKPYLMSAAEKMGIDTEGSFISGIMSWIGGNSSDPHAGMRFDKTLQRWVPDEKANSLVDSAIEELKKNLDFNTEAISSSGGGGGGSSSKAKTKEELLEEEANEVVEKYKKFIDRKNNEISDYELDFNLWAAANPNAEEAEKEEKQFELLIDKIKSQTEVANLADQEYKEVCKILGEDADLTKESLRKLKNEKLELAELLNSINEAEEEVNKNAKSVTSMSLDDLKELKPQVIQKWVDECAAAGAVWEKQVERLKEMGEDTETLLSGPQEVLTETLQRYGMFTKEELYQAATDAEKVMNEMTKRTEQLESGANKLLTERRQEIDDALAITGQKDVDIYGKALLEEIEKKKPEVAAATTSTVSEATKTAANSTEVKSETKMLGETVATGVANGITSKQDAISNALGNALDNAIAANQSKITTLGTISSVGSMAITGTANSSGGSTAPVVTSVSATSAKTSDVLYATGTTSKLASSAAASSSGSTNNTTTNQTNNFTFNQTNTSTKPISSLDTYRASNSGYASFRESITSAISK